MYRHHAEGRGEQTAGKGRPLLEHILLLVQDTEMSSWAVVSEVLRRDLREGSRRNVKRIDLRKTLVGNPAVAIHCPEVPADAEHGHGPEDIAGPQPEVGVGDASSQEVRRHALERLGQVLSPVGERSELGGFCNPASFSHPICDIRKCPSIRAVELDDASIVRVVVGASSDNLGHVINVDRVHHVLAISNDWNVPVDTRPLGHVVEEFVLLAVDHVGSEDSGFGIVFQNRLLTQRLAAQPR
mmetsp:Transcript_6137/g.14169  ORF Transcript_6137/g.14169 Transcript_6137/m.14169 type:complete len:241 (-) Transcript_6137:489-1211(-)